jgi:hypothetical protein
MGNIIPRNVPVGANKRHIFGTRGCYKQAVKWVPMNPRQPFKGIKMGCLNGKYDNLVFLGEARKDPLDGVGEVTDNSSGGALVPPVFHLYCPRPPKSDTEIRNPPSCPPTSGERAPSTKTGRVWMVK